MFRLSESSSGINIQDLLVHIVLQFFYVLVELLQWGSIYALQNQGLTFEEE